jgi:hypothetical protein
MPDLSELLRQSVAREATTYEPSAALPQRIARRTLQLQRRRRGRIVGGAAAFAVVMLAVPLVINPMRNHSTAVSIAYGPVPITAKHVRVTTTTTTPIVAVQLLDLQAFIDHGVKERNKALRKIGAALKKHAREAAAKERDQAEVLGDTAERATPAPNNASPGGTTATTGGSSTTTDPPTTATTGPPPPTTQPTTPRVPLAIIPPDHVCAGVPAVFRATGTGAELVVWSNLQVGATATFVLTQSTNVIARLEVAGSLSSQSYSVQVTPTGTPPC